jgi:hypothetical protein
MPEDITLDPIQNVDYEDEEEEDDDCEDCNY